MGERPQKSAKGAVAPQRGNFSYAIEAEPAWVVAPVEAPAAAVDSSAMHYRLIDQQLLIEGKSVWDYNHLVRVVDNVSGLSSASQIEIEFDPVYQTLALHRVDVVRAGKRISKIDRQKIQVLQRETQLERQMYDGRATLSVVLDDVRAGDEIDYSYSIRGANPVFGGKFVAAESASAYRGPVALFQLRVLAPVDRPIKYLVGPADASTVSRVVGARRETVFRRVSVPQFNPEAESPQSVELAQEIQLSEFADWGEVARWGTALFSDAGLRPRVDAIAQEILGRTPDRQERVLAALKFVQQEVRYFGTEIGTSSHRPAAPDQVIEQRFGDCKDKVALFVALLRRMDIDATPVLVSTRYRGQLEQMLPSPLAFDHVIARVDVDGTAYWLDGTRSHQSGRLPARQSVDFRLGLALEQGATALSALPGGFDAERQIVEDTIRFEKLAADPVLESRVTYRGLLAEYLREAVSSRGLEALRTQLASPYVKVYPKITSTGALEVVDSADDDAVTFVQRFSVPSFWRFPDERVLSADIVYWGTIGALNFPKAETRRDPFGITFAGIYRHTITIDFPEDVTSRPVNLQFSDGDSHFSWSGSFNGDPRRAVYRSRLRLSADQVQAKDWPAYTAKLVQLAPKLALAVNIPALSPAALEATLKDMKAAEDAIRAGRPKLVTKEQIESHLKAILLSAQIASGRLPPALEAQALVARGIRYDHLGRLADAKRDFDRSMELAPNINEAQNAAAVNAWMSGEFARSVELTSRVLERDPGNGEARNTRAIARYFMKESDAAHGDLVEVLKDPSAVRRGYPIVWLSMVMRQSGRDVTQLQTTFVKDQLPTQWPRPLLDFALGTATAEFLVDAARRSSAPQESLCEAYFYIAERYRAEGSPARAVEYWRKSVDTGMVEYLENGASKLRLAEAASK